MNDSDFVKVMEYTAKGIVVAVKGSTILSFVISIFFNAALGFLLQMIGIIQIALHLPLMNIKFPANALTFVAMIIPTVNYDLLNGVKWYNDIIVGVSKRFQQGKVNPNF